MVKIHLALKAPKAVRRAAKELSKILRKVMCLKEILRLKDARVLGCVVRSFVMITFLIRAAAQTTRCLKKFQLMANFLKLTRLKKK